MTSPAVAELGRTFWDSLRSPRYRSHLQFAEDELVIADGPYKGTRFSTGVMPFTRLVLEEYWRRRYRRFFLTGPVQSWKTLGGYITPGMYHICERRDDVIFGAPTADLAWDIFKDRMMPSIRASRYRAILPVTGPGSKGGKTLVLRLLNGVIVRFMAAGGGDQQRSSYPAPVVIMTELDKMDTPGKASKETNPVSQMEARSDAWGDDATVYGECSMSNEYGRIFTEVNKYGTGTSPYFRCPGCRKPVPLERENFIGWKDAPDIAVARATAAFVCPSCGKPWTEADRTAALQEPVLVSRGQSINEAGEVVGDPPSTITFGIRWTGLASPFRSMAAIAEKEWRAEYGSDDDKKELYQFVYALPYSGEGVDVLKLEAERILQKSVGHARGVVPPDTKALTLGIDVGKYKCWWALYAWTETAFGHVVDFGEIEVEGQKKESTNPLLILAALQQFRETRIKPGWGGRQPDLTLLDSGFENYDVIYPFVKESGQGRYFASKGFGTTIKNRPWHQAQNSTTTRQVGNNWRGTLMGSDGIILIEVHSDYWKGQLQDGYGAAPGAPGSITLFQISPREREARDFAAQITAERRFVEQPKGKEQVVSWVVESRKNHYLDVGVLARVAADMRGIRLVQPKKPAPPSRAKSAEVPPERRIRTKY